MNDQETKGASFDDNLIDKAVADLVGTKEEIRQNGLMLRLCAEAGEIGGDGATSTIRVGRDMPEIKEVPLSRLRRAHRLSDITSLIDFANKIATDIKTKDGESNFPIVFVSESGATVVPDDCPKNGDREEISCEFELTGEFQAWRDAVAVGKTMIHRHLLPFLIRVQETLKDPAILTSMQDASIRSKVANTSIVSRDDKHIGFYVETTKGERLKKFPDSFVVRLPVFIQDIADATSWVDFKVHLNIDLPETPEGQVEFQLISGELEAALQRRIATETDRVRSDVVDSYLVVRGDPSYRSPERVKVVSNSLEHDES